MGIEGEDSEEEMRTTFLPMNSWLALARERRIERPCFTRMRRITVGQRSKSRRIHSYFWPIRLGVNHEGSLIKPICITVSYGNSDTPTCVL